MAFSLRALGKIRDVALLKNPRCNRRQFATIDTRDHREQNSRLCSRLLPWALDQIREVAGVTLSEAPAEIAKLIAEIQGNSRSAIA
jgi:hypothetical protein